MHRAAMFVLLVSTKEADKLAQKYPVRNPPWSAHKSDLATQATAYH